VRYQPEVFGGEGAAALAMGNPDTAVNTAVLVKGLGSGVFEGTLANPDGIRLYDETARAAGDTPTSVVLWIGYDAPNDVTDLGLYEPDMARTGGQLLAKEVNAFGVTHEPGPTHVTVVGHSYGSTVVADAAAAFGMRSDDVVLVGSPGTDLAHSAAAFRLPPSGHLYVGAASADAVTWSPGQLDAPTVFGPTLGGLGDDPCVDGYGSTRFKAEVPGYTIDPIYDHSHYFDDGSESLFSIADVASGHGDALQRDGMTAPHRGVYGMAEWFDPEAFRSATTGHTHRAPAG
jgi:pimeloyl-ACP methyl ester carboxylesterase